MSSLVRVEILEPNGNGFGTQITPDLATLQGLVGGYIQVISIGNGQILVINEEAKLGPHERNAQATAKAEGHLFAGDYIAGTAVLMQDGGLQ